MDCTNVSATCTLAQGCAAFDRVVVARVGHLAGAVITLLRELTPLGIADGSRAAYVAGCATPEPARAGKVECYVCDGSTAAGTCERLCRAAFALFRIALHLAIEESNRAAWNCGWKEGFP